MAASAAVLLAILTLGELGLESALIAKENVTEEDLATAWTLSALRGLVTASGVWLLAGMVSDLMRMPLLEPLLRVHTLALIIQGFYSPAMAILMKTLDLKGRVTMDVVRRPFSRRPLGPAPCGFSKLLLLFNLCVRRGPLPAPSPCIGR